MSYEEVLALERVARRAPSPHNTQPWRLVYCEDGIRLGYDSTRHLAASDPTNRDLLLSLGCFIEAFLIASREARIGLQFVPDVDLQDRRIGWFHVTATLYESRFTSADIINRRTSRLRYLPVLVNDALRTSLEDCRSPAERIVYLRGADIRDLLTPADRHLFDTPPIAAELRAWSRLTDIEIAQSEDGLSADCLAIGRLESHILALLLSARVYPWFRRLRLFSLIAGATRRTVTAEAHVVSIVRQFTEPFDAVEAGRTLMRLLLTLSRAGLYAHPLSQILDCPSTHRQLSERLRRAPQEAIMCLFRFGVSQTPARSRRLGEAFDGTGQELHTVSRAS